ncbi:hypothetical protein O4J56_09275 [Nocardiopsis sp. RSe5-2]|uniref:DUF4232 domain-containing protein n=1 Tax=Nocardiopsis endophytica TaxID=3018445 RepID=A0ABT4U1J6_9ACTN|nr:hypothetical protein [Nocardiopsis endophytica]MDA2810823.1 hypothetical protein [Nocardiopsis endophytica]
MASSAGHPGPVSPGTYWKRRVFVLVGLLAVVTLIAYACRPSASDTENAAGASPEASSSPSAEPSSSVAPSPTPSTSPSGDDEGGDDGDEGDSSGGSGDGESGSGSGGSDSKDDGKGDGGKDSDEEYPAPKKASDPCRPSDVVVTVETDKSDYAWDAKPKIEVTAVNTAEQTCTVDLGPENMEVRVTSGDDRVFSTADCAVREDENKVELERGVPEKTSFTWDRKRSWKDCRDTEATAKRPGTYVATLKGDYASDKDRERQVFRLN